MKTDADSYIRVERTGAIARVTLNRPPHNSMSVALARTLADAMEALEKTDGVRVVILAADGKSFCAGADLGNRSEYEGETPDSGNPLYNEVVRLCAVSVPVVAAIQGAAIGAGLGLAVLADFRVASPDARFAANFVKLGLHPGFGLTATLPRLLGRQRATDLLLTGRRVKADEALALGLVDRLATETDLLDVATAIAHEVAENAPLAVRATRQTLRADLVSLVRAATDHEHSEQRWLMTTADFREGVTAVSERRPGRFAGR